MIDMGEVDGKRLFYTGGRSFEELILAGEVLAIPDAETGLVFKRTERCTPLEKMAAFSVDEAKAFIAEWNARIDNDQNT